MNRLLASTLFLLALPLAAIAQVTLIIDGKTVTKGTVTIITEASPPTCPTGTSWNGSACAATTPTCPTGTSWNGSACVATVPTCPTGTFWNGSACVAPPPPGAGITVISADPPFGNMGGELPEYSMSADQVIAFKIPAERFDNARWTAYYPSTGLSLSISATPGDFGTRATNDGCYRTMGGGIMTNPGIRTVKGGVSAYELCPTPASIDGYLYVNVRWPIYTSYQGQPVNLLRTFLFKEVGTFQFRRDS